MEFPEFDKHPYDRSGEADEYFVVFWSDLGYPQNLPRKSWFEQQVMVKSEDVREVIAWAEAEAKTIDNFELYQLFVVAEDGEGDYLMRLIGPEDPTFGDDDGESRVAGWQAAWANRYRIEAR